MKMELIKDIIITLIILMTDVIYMPFPAFLPYFYSFLKSHDLSITFSFSYCLVVFIYTGSIFGNLLLPKCFYVLGVKKTFIFGGLIYLLNNLFIVNFPSKLSGIIFGLISGICYNFKTVPTNYLLSSKYENGVSYIGYSYMGQSFGVIFWVFLMQLWINPSNENMDKMTEANGFKEYYFGPNVTNNFYFFVSMNGVVAFLVIFVVALFLNDPKNSQGNLLLWIKAFIQGDEEAQKRLKEEEITFQESYKNTQSKLELSAHVQMLENSMNQSQRKSELSQKSNIELKLMDVQDQAKIYENDPNFGLTVEEQITKELHSPKFIIFILITFIKNSSSTLFINSFKMMAGVIIQNDALASCVFALAAIPDIFGRFFVSYCWDNYGFYKTYIGSFIYSFFFMFLFIVIGYNNSVIFIIITGFVSLVWAFNYILGHTTIFGLFAPEKAVGLSKGFDIYYILQSLYGVLMIHLYLQRNEFRMCYVVFMSIELIAFIVFCKFYKKFGDLNTERKINYKEDD